MGHDVEGEAVNTLELRMLAGFVDTASEVCGTQHLQTQVGTVVRINQRTATVDTGDGHSWRVGFAPSARTRHLNGVTLT